MIQLDKNTFIDVEPMELMEFLRQYFFIQNNIELFKVLRPNRDNIQTNCPFHKEGQERKPSFGVNAKINKCHCFTCGWAGSIQKMISDILGWDDDGKMGLRILKKTFDTTTIEHRKDIIKPSMIQRNKTTKQKTKFVDNKKVRELNNTFWQSKDAIEYIRKRGFDDVADKDLLQMFEVGYDWEKAKIIFPVRELNGDCVFLAGRSIYNKFFTLPDEVDKPVYAAGLFSGGVYDTCYITESFFNCWTLWKYKMPAVALMGTGSQKQIEILNKLPVREYILALDPDGAGNKGKARLVKGLKNKLLWELDYKDCRDINELGSEVKELKTKLVGRFF